MEDFFTSITSIVQQAQENMHLVFLWLIVLWGVFFLNKILDYRLNVFGIYPRKVSGIIGIAASPFLHANFEHLFFNSIPFFALASLVALNGKVIFYGVSISIIVIAGTFTWLIGRRAIHVGASSLIMGYWSYLLMLAWYQQSALSIFLGVICIYYFGSLFFDLFPKQDRSSWEGHLCGFAAGILTYYYLPFLFSNTPLRAWATMLPG